MESRTRYDNVTKDCWRRWVWNEMANRLGEGAKVLCLCGSTPNDLFVAREKRLTAIGVDIDKSCVDTWRKHGGVAIYDKIHRILPYMQNEIDGVILDELGGISSSSHTNFSIAILGYKCVAGNYLRGRDPIGGRLRKQIESDFHGVQLRYMTRQCRFKKTNIGLHRGKVLWMACQVYGLTEAGYGGWISKDEWNAWDAAISKKFKPMFHSYKSKDGSLIYDSIIVNGFCNDVISGIRPKNGRTWTSKRKVAAAKALLTMRRNSST